MIKSFDRARPGFFVAIPFWQDGPMTIADRWLLPDGMDEVLPPQATRMEELRRALLDLYYRWGYDLVMPPPVEFLDSLLLGRQRF